MANSAEDSKFFKLSGDESLDGDRSPEMPGTVATAEPHLSSMMNLSEKDIKFSHMISRLRDKGIEKHIRTPQIIVCGYQSSGKSSVLQAISGISLPVDKSTCTNCVIEIITSKSTTPMQSEVYFRPNPNSTARDALLGFKRKSTGDQDLRDELAGFLKSARELVEDLVGKSTITDDVLVVKVSGPSLRDLRFIDLPGLFGSEVGGGVRDRTRKIMRTYMEMDESIILAVVPAIGNADGAAAQLSIFDDCSDYDPNFVRSIAVVTHPDRSSDHQAEWISTVQGEAIHPSFKGPWHVVRNPDFEQRQLIIEGQADRDQLELEFFQTSDWHNVPEGSRGASSLQSRLERLLLSKQKEMLPDMHVKLKSLLDIWDGKLFNLRFDIDSDMNNVEVFKERLDLLRMAAKDDTTGYYQHSQIANKTTGPSFIRARVRDEQEWFRDNMIQYGHTYSSYIAEEVFKPYPSASTNPYPGPVPQQWQEWRKEQKFSDDTEEIAKCVELLRSLRGNEGDWFATPQRIDVFFWMMSEHWAAVAELHVKRVHEHCTDYFKNVTPQYFDIKTQDGTTTGFRHHKILADKLIERHVKVKLQSRLEDALKELSRVNKDRKMPSINVDWEYLEAQKAASWKQEFTRSNRAKHALDAKPKGESKAFRSQDPLELAKASGQDDIGGKYKGTAYEFVNSANMHYGMTRKLWIANVVNQVMERHLMRDLYQVIPRNLKDDEIYHLIAEDGKKKGVELTKFTQERNELEDFLKTIDEWLMEDAPIC